VLCGFWRFVQKRHEKMGPMTFSQIIILLLCKVKFPAGRQRFVAFVNVTQMYTVFPASRQLNAHFKWTFYHIRRATTVFLPSGYSREVMRERLNHSSDNHRVFIITRKPFVCSMLIHRMCTAIQIQPMEIITFSYYYIIIIKWSLEIFHTKRL